MVIEHIKAEDRQHAQLMTLALKAQSEVRQDGCGLCGSDLLQHRRQQCVIACLYADDLTSQG